MELGRAEKEMWFGRVGIPKLGENLIRGMVGQGRGEEEHKRSRMMERTKKHLSSLSALNSLQHGEDRRGTEIEEAQKIDIGGVQEFFTGKGTGAVQRSYQRDLKDRGKRKHQHLQFLLSYSYLSSSQHNYSCLQKNNMFAEASAALPNGSCSW